MCFEVSIRLGGPSCSYLGLSLFSTLVSSNSQFVIPDLG